ncbi:MAG: hypothetical protein HKL85_12440 [Acidimicrobiaceae bacterium]|nr:hypothetical protein [Acidimicrobiaceae bacterium]
MSTAPAANGDRSFAPVAGLTTGALTLVVIGGIVMASYAPRRPPLDIIAGLLGLAVALLLTVIVIFTRLSDFAWSTFMLVFKWALLAYVVEAGIIEFSFIRNHTSGSSLVIVSGMLVVFGVSVPTMIAFTAARFAEGGT